MNNYYETCLATLNELIQGGKENEALSLVSQELAMPYVPEPYFSKFEAIRDHIVIDRSPASRYFEDVESIGAALLGNETLQHKALISLERMNLRQDIDTLLLWFKEPLIPDWIKKQLLFFAMEQDLNLEVEINLDSKDHVLNLKDLKNPFATQSFVNCEKELRDILESHNPSMLLLCVSHLETKALEAFPLSKVEFKASDIVLEVESYLKGA